MLTPPQRVPVPHPLICRHWIDAQIESFKGAGAEQNKIGRLTKHDFVDGRSPTCVNKSDASPPSQHGTIGLPKAPRVRSLRQLSNRQTVVTGLADQQR